MSGLFAARGSLSALAPEARAHLIDRGAAQDDAIREQTASLIRTVREAGDAALRRMSSDFDGALLGELEVPRTAWLAARDGLDPALRTALERAAENIRAAHEAFAPTTRRFVSADGVVLERRPGPLDRVGVYAPGGRAAYPSSLLMGLVPARVAGVPQVIICSPPGPAGIPDATVLAAAAIGGADRLFAVGGAGAIAAMAYGTSSIPRVDRIVGPGNAWVMEAKLQVSHMVGIDSPAGPSELLILADDSAGPAALARELAAQAEHDPRAAVVLITTAAGLGDAVERELTRLLDRAPRAAIIREALAARSASLTADTLDEALAFASDYGAEHVLVACRNARAVADRVRHAGTVFIGESSSVAFGDYLTGANHVLPTGGTTRCWSGLSTDDFCRWTTYQEVSPQSAALLAADAECLARAEGLPAHAEAARAWGPKG